MVVRFDGGVQTRAQDRLPGSDFALALPDAEPKGATGLIEDIEPMATYMDFGVPNDPAYRAQWHLPVIDATLAWDVTTGAGTIAAVIDSGVAYETWGPYGQAPDLAGASFVPGWDFVGGDPHANDENGHGTRVAGSVAQATERGSAAPGSPPTSQSCRCECSTQPVRAPTPTWPRPYALPALRR